MIVQFRVYRDLTIRCWSLNVEGSSFYSPTPRRLRRPTTQTYSFWGLGLNLVYGFLLSFKFVHAARAGQGKGRAGRGQGRGGQSAKKQGQGAGRAPQQPVGGLGPKHPNREFFGQ